jgi:hypothetical protein
VLEAAVDVDELPQADSPHAMTAARARATPPRASEVLVMVMLMVS